MYDQLKFIIVTFELGDVLSQKEPKHVAVGSNKIQIMFDGYSTDFNMANTMEQVT